MLNLSTFWELLDRAAEPGDGPGFLQRLHTELSRLPLVDLEAFQRHLWTLHLHSATPQLWGAAYLAMGGCSDDSFDYFRSWLISRGRAAFERVVARPDRLAELLAHRPGDPRLEELLSLAEDVCDERFGSELGEAAYAVSRPEPVDTDSLDFDDEHVMKRQYPELHRLFWGKPL